MSDALICTYPFGESENLVSGSPVNINKIFNITANIAFKNIESPINYGSTSGSATLITDTICDLSFNTDYDLFINIINKYLSSGVCDITTARMNVQFVSSTIPQTLRVACYKSSIDQAVLQKGNYTLMVRSDSQYDSMEVFFLTFARSIGSSLEIIRSKPMIFPALLYTYLPPSGVQYGYNRSGFGYCDNVTMMGATPQADISFLNGTGDCKLVIQYDAYYYSKFRFWNFAPFTSSYKIDLSIIGTVK